MKSSVVLSTLIACLAGQTVLAQEKYITNIGDGSLLLCIQEAEYEPYLGFVEDPTTQDYFEAEISDGLQWIKRQIRRTQKKIRRMRRSRRGRSKEQLTALRAEIQSLKSMREEVRACEAEELASSPADTPTAPATPPPTTGSTSSACGLITATSTSSTSAPRSLRIINGESCDSILSPVVELLMADANGSAFSRCTGTVVSDTGIVTAAHCFDSNVKMIYIRTGNVTLVSQRFGAHPNWQAQPSDYIVERQDIAYVVAPQSLGVPAVPILGSNQLVVGESVLIAGYGLNEKLQSDGLRAGYMTLNSYDDTSVVALYDGRTGSNSCSGDSGGPLMVQRSGVWYLAGVTSNGDNAQCGANGGTDVSRWSNINSPLSRSFVRDNLGL